MADRAVRYERRLRRRIGAEQLARRFADKHGDTVRTGPFKGMTYGAAGDSAVSKYLGLYEGEIAEWIDDALAARPRRIIDIGAADGYYALGLLLAAPDASITAFELSSEARRACRRNARANKARLDLRGRATERRLLALPADQAFVLCDCEGAEVDILTPRVARHFRSATLIVELHDGLRPGARNTVIQRFEQTHEVEIRGIDETLPHVPELLGDWTDEERQLALSEHRSPDVCWARCAPRRTSLHPSQM
jgi:predicted O-methyltransferase YrrM